MKSKTAIAATVLTSCNPQNDQTEAGDYPYEDRIATALLDYQLRCRCKSCLSELIVARLRAMHLYNSSRGDVCAGGWRWSRAVCEPFTTIEAALLDTNDEHLIRLAYPALASLIEKELRARYEEDFVSAHEVEERPRGFSCTVAARHWRTNLTHAALS